MKFVLDCSVTMAWCFEDETNAYTEQILELLQKGHQAMVPPIWRLEVCNVLLLAIRKRRINETIASHFKEALLKLPIIVEEKAAERIFDTVYALAHQYELTAYDAAYLELAMREKIPLATQDKKLLAVANKIDLRLQSPCQQSL